VSLLQGKKVFIAGHRGLVGSAIVRVLKRLADVEILVCDREDLDLLNQRRVREYLEVEAPDMLVNAAGRVGGILANSQYPAEFIYNNLVMSTNLIEAAYRAGVHDGVFFGSSCIYPKECPQPIKEEYILTGALEPTNSAYAIAKIAGLKLCESYNRQYSTRYKTLMPTNLYGPGDNFHLADSHVLPALVHKVHEAVNNNDDKVVLWGTGMALREFLFIDDLAAACIHVMNMTYEDYRNSVPPGIEHLNVGTGHEIRITELIKIIQELVGFEGIIEFDTSKPDGTMRKVLDVSRITATGWRAVTPLEEGIRKTYEWFLTNTASLRS
jgi:nucleoside-diphosphate-sugar epimerase